MTEKLNNNTVNVYSYKVWEIMSAICNICGKKFKSQFALNGHKKMKDDAEHRAWREKNIDQNNRSDMKKSVVHSQKYPPEVLEKAKELLEKEARDKIIDEYHKNVIIPMFDNGSWLYNDTHQRILAKKDEDHQLEISSITASHQREKEDMEQQIEYQRIEINKLNEKIFWLNDHIGNRLDNEVISGQEELKHNQDVFNAEKVDFDGYKNAERSKLDKSKSELEKNQKIVEMRENVVADREESLKKQKEEFTRYEERVNNEIEEKIKIVNDRMHNVIESEKRFQKLADEMEKKHNLERKSIKDVKDQMEREIKNKMDKQADEIKDEREKIKKEWESINKIKKEQKAERQRLQKRDIRLMTNRIFNIFPSPNTKYGASKLLDGANHTTTQINHGTFRNDLPHEGKSNDIHRAIPVAYLVSSSGVPISQSGDPPPLISSDEVKTIKNSGKPILQSGYTNYYSGAGNFNKK